MNYFAGAIEFTGTETALILCAFLLAILIPAALLYLFGSNARILSRERREGNKIDLGRYFLTILLPILLVSCFLGWLLTAFFLPGASSNENLKSLSNIFSRFLPILFILTTPPAIYYRFKK